MYFERYDFDYENDPYDREMYERLVFDQPSGNQCFVVNYNAQEREIPSTGDEYLLSVVRERQHTQNTRLDVELRIPARYLLRERQRIPAVVWSSRNLCPETIEDSDSEMAEPESENVTSPFNRLKPSRDWQKVQAEDFAALCKYVRHQMTVRRGSLSSSFQASYREFLRYGQIQWRRVFQYTEPTLSHVIGLRNNTVESGMNTIMSLLNEVAPGQTIDARIASWVHGLLTVFRHPPLPHDYFTLRSLSKKCWQIRANLNPNAENAEELAKPLNIIICIIAKNFGQQDLGDEELYDSKVGVIYYDSKVERII